ncbi:MAG: hypothetical protein L3J46_07530 [Kangiellaceae bacterium]|nr:hypothetical protein [Kangiellaceae bacterium]
MDNFVAITKNGTYLRAVLNSGFGTKEDIRETVHLNDATIFTNEINRTAQQRFHHSDVERINSCNHLPAKEIRIVKLIKDIV